MVDGVVVRCTYPINLHTNLISSLSTLATNPLELPEKGVRLRFAIR